MTATLDGNALVGPLAELFAIDLATAVLTCAHCGSSGPLAAHLLYACGPAMVLRCRSCAEVVLRYASDGGGIRLDMSGTRLLTVGRDEPGR
jgi:hypothetical protein